MSRLLISAAHKSSGKTTISLGLCAALAERNYIVQPFKKGPDYIDPMWLGLAAGRACYNLDFHCMTHEEILGTLGQHSANADIALIEGNKGLYDGLDLNGSNSNAALAKLTDTPVVLVLDARGMTRGIAPLILGYQAFDPDIRIVGVILNQLGGSRHEAKLRSVIEHYTDAQVLGGIHRNSELEIVERHLGLVPSNETGSPLDQIKHIRDIVRQQVDVERVLEIAGKSPLNYSRKPAYIPPSGKKLKIGIIRDAAFGFYYPDDLAALEEAGGELVAIDSLRDTSLPALDGLFIGGGFPESHMALLEANAGLRREIKAAIENGLPTYAECGGLMYLSRSLTWKNRCCEMVGIIPGDAVMHDRPQGRGYVQLRETACFPWPSGRQQGDFAGHEFHYSRLENISGSLEYAYQVLRGTGVDGQHDGIVINRLLACYSHLRDTQQHHWARRFIEYVRQHTPRSRKTRTAV